nr:uncharacterized protein LOC124805812 isoform X2 [Hydra vulgaris]XP_047132816.1 uncharacterized protein LOC124805812 isoform X2 [Hydra vulgaris]
MHYPEQRRLSEIVKDDIGTMFKLGVKVCFLKEYLKNKERKIVTSKDLFNINKKIELERNSEKSNEALLIDELMSFCEKDPDAVISVQVDSDGVLQFLLLISGDMQQVFDMFPEVLMIDCTYCTNKLRMPLFTLLVEDGNGTGQAVGYAFIAQETENTLHDVFSEIELILNLNQVKVVILDKDLKEIGAVSKVMPTAEIQLCKFHVLQAFYRFLNKQGLASIEKDNLKKIFKSLVYAKSKKSFDINLGHLATVAPEVVMAYYNKNWGLPHQVKYWAYYETIKYVNLGNTTNNRSESHNQKIKNILSRKMSLAEAVKCILLLHTCKFEQMAHIEFNQSFKESYRLGTDEDVVTDDIVKVLTPYAAGIVIAELKKSRTNLLVLNKVCSCPLQVTMKLPCRHTMAVKIVNGDAIFKADDAGERWHLSYQKKSWLSRKTRSLHNQANNVFHFSTNKTEKKTLKVPFSKDQKFKTAMNLCKPISDYLSTLGMNEFEEKIDSLNLIYKLWLAGKKVIISDMEAQALPEISNLPKVFALPEISDLPEMSDFLETSELPEMSDLPEMSSSPNFSESLFSALPSSLNLNEQLQNQGNVLSPNQFSLNDCVNFKDLPTTKSECCTGQAINIFNNLANVCLPKVPPVVGNVKIKKARLKRKRGLYNDPYHQSCQRILGKTAHKEQLLKKQHSVIDLQLFSIKDSFEMLSDLHINKAQKLLSMQFPDVKGLQDLILGSKLHFRVQSGKFVQILHNGAMHWLTISNFLSTHLNSVDVFDSLYYDLSVSGKMQVGSIMMVKEPFLKLQFKDFQKQSGGVDCGLFAIAAATDLCYNYDPSIKCYKQELMRDHLLKCFSDNYLTPFPIETNERKKKKLPKPINVPLYCICRLPDNKEEKMVKCNNCKE